MKKIILIAFTFISFSAHADFIWLAAGAAYSQVSNMYPSDAEDIKFGSSYFVDFDAAPRLPFLLGHYGYKYNLTHSADVKFNGQSPREATFNFSTHELGLKFMLPFERFELYGGGGGLFGQARLEDETDTVSGESRSLGGYYWHVGYHYMFTQQVGIKFAYQSNHIQTDKMKNLDKRKMSFDQQLAVIGITIRFKN